MPRRIRDMDMSPVTREMKTGVGERQREETAEHLQILPLAAATTSRGADQEQRGRKEAVYRRCGAGCRSTSGESTQRVPHQSANSPAMRPAGDGKAARPVRYRGGSKKPARQPGRSRTASRAHARHEPHSCRRLRNDREGRDPRSWRRPPRQRSPGRGAESVRKEHQARAGEAPWHVAFPLGHLRSIHDSTPEVWSPLTTGVAQGLPLTIGKDRAVVLRQTHTSCRPLQAPKCRTRAI